MPWSDRLTHYQIRCHPHPRRSPGGSPHFAGDSMDSWGLKRRSGESRHRVAWCGVWSQRWPSSERCESKARLFRVKATYYRVVIERKRVRTSTGLAASVVAHSGCIESTRWCMARGHEPRSPRSMRIMENHSCVFRVHP